MQGLKDSCDTMLRTWVRGASRVGVVCGVVAMLVLVTGCPPGGITPATCDGDAACDDGAFCNGAETCVDSACVAAEAPCADTDVCNEDLDQCEECGNDGQDACPDGQECVEGTCADIDLCADVTCEEGEECDADTGDCVVTDPCAGNTCDDGDACNGVETCDEATGDCVDGTALECDDGDACNGEETCDADTGCVDGTAVECDPGDMCVEGECVEDLCFENDCDDEDPCNGVETCDADTGDCVDGEAVTCDDGFECDADTGECVEVTEAFTVGDDVSSDEGNSGTTDYAFTVTRNSGTDAKTLDYAVTGGTGTGDAAADDFDGGAFPSGTVAWAADETGGMTITVKVAGDTNVESDETFTLTVTDPDDSDATVGTATGTIVNDDSSAAPTFTLPTNAGATVGQNSTISGVSVSDADNGTSTVDIDTADGFVSFSAAPVATAVDGNGNAVTTANVLKAGYTLTGSITNINTTLAGLQFTTDRSSGNPGTDQIDFTGTDADGGVGTATLDINVGVQMSLTSVSDTGTGFTGTPGGDVFLATTPSFWGQGDVLAGGDGPDMIEIRAAANATYPSADVAAFSCTGIEKIWISSTTGAPTIDNLGDVSGLDTITYWPSGAHALTVDDAPDGCTVNVTTDNGAFGAAVDIDIKSATFGVQGFTVNMLGDSTNGCVITTLDNGTGDVENLTLHSASRNGTTTTANALSTGAGGSIALTSLTITGDSNLNIGTWAAGDAANISAAAFTGNLTVTSYAHSGGSLAGGTGNDTLVCGANAQSISGGAGNDTMTGGAGADQYTCGAGNDTLLQTSNDGIDTVTDFDFGTSSTAVDTITFSLAAIEARAAITDLTSASLVSTSAADAMVYTTLSADAATPGDVDIIGIIGDYANAAAALTAKTSWTITYGSTATADDAILIAYTSGTSVRIAVIVNTATATSDGIDSIEDLLILQNTTLANLDSLDFNALGT